MKQQLIRKLGNSIRKYRGITQGVRKDGSPIWRESEQKKELEHLTSLINKLNLPTTETITRINNFKTWSEYNEWIKTV